MKIIKKIICIFIAALMLICVCSCSDKYVMKLDGGYKLEEDVYEWIVSYCKTNEYATFAQYLESRGEDVSSYNLTSYDFWNTEYGDDSKTLAQRVSEEAVVVGKSYLSSAKLFDDNGLEITKDDKNAISNAMDTVDEQFKMQGTTLKDYLANFGISVDTYKKVLMYQYKSQKLLAKLTAPGSEYEVTDEDIAAIYDKVVDERGYSNVNHIFLYSVTFDSSGKSKPLSDEDYQKIKAKATEVYEAIVSGQAEFEEFGEMSDDKYSPNGYLVNSETDMTEEFVNASIDMKVGEIRLVESEGIGFHIIKKYEITDEQKTEIEDSIRAELEADEEERIVDVYYDDIIVDEQKISEYDPVYASLLM